MKEEEFNIESLRQPAPTNFKEVSINEIKPKDIKKRPEATYRDDVALDINDAITRKKVEFANFREELREEIAEEQLTKEIEQDFESDIDAEIESDSFESNVAYDDFDDDENDAATITDSHNHPDEDSAMPHNESKHTIPMKANIVESEYVDDDVEKALDEDLDADETEDILDGLKTSVKERIQPVLNKVDLASFTISKKPLSMSATLKAASTKIAADWVLPISKKLISVSEFTGPEIAKLNPRSYSRGRYNVLKQVYKMIFDHIENKGNITYEGWLKTFNYYDLDHLFFGIYKASFGGANYIPLNCTECKHSWVEAVDIESMVKYSTPEMEDMINKILSKISIIDAVDETELVQISDDYAVTLKSPSIYTMLLEPALLDSDFTTKYSEAMEDVAIIDGIYYIDRVAGELRPLYVKEYPNDEVKNIKSRILRYSKFLGTLTADQYSTFKAYGNSILEKRDSITYRYPEVVCPKCGAKIPEAEQSAEGMIFTRHQLVTIANS